MKVESITIRNFKGIGYEKLSLNGNNVYVLGRNGMGKTSFLDAIFKILSGKNLPPQPTTAGEKQGSIEIDLGQIIVKSKFNSKTEKYTLTVESKEGAQYPSPRKMLDELVGVVDFDVTGFMKLAPSKQVEKIKELSGIDFSDLDVEYKRLYEERTFVNRKVTELEIQQVPFDKDKLIVTDLTEATEALNKKREFNDSYKEGQSIVKQKKELQEKILSDILKLESSINKLRSQDYELGKEIVEAESWLADEENKPYDLEAEEAAFLQSIEDNKKIEENIKNKKLYDDFIVELEKQKDLEAGLEKIATTKKTAIEEADLPVPGLSFNDDGLTYHGLPFEDSQINTANKIIIGLQINRALLGDVKIARFDGSLIDNENMEYIEDWANKNDLQLFVEIVDRNAEQLTIEVKEG